jgi:hypothetical protein
LQTKHQININFVNEGNWLQCRSMNIPPDALALYKAYKMTSSELSKLTGYHPVSLRRAIQRERPPKPADRSGDLRKAREAYRATICHLPLKKIMELAGVSISTAARIRKQYGP